MATDPNRVKAIFLEATELSDDAARTEFLDQACGDDASLRDRVEDLLRSREPDGSFLATPAARILEPDLSATHAYRRDADDAGHSTGGGTSGTPDDEVPIGFLAPSTRPDSLGRIGHYEVLQFLGQGGFGIVFRAFDDVLQRVVAVKVLAPQLAATSPARKRFLREARTSAAVRHDYVLQVYEVGETPLPYIAMEFIPGETLQQRLNRIGPFEAVEVVRIGRQIAEGLAAAHSNDLIHRDIKPGNILLEGGASRVKITDFGLARAADDASISQSGIIAGTPMYMAPKQAKGEKLDQRADLFSLGSVLYQMACGRPPFRANSTVAVLKRVAEDTPRDIREIVPEVPQWLCVIIAKLHAKNPEERFHSAREVADVLADCEAQLKENAKLKDFSRIPKGKPPVAAKSGWQKWVAAVAMLLTAVAAATPVSLWPVGTHLTVEGDNVGLILIDEPDGTVREVSAGNSRMPAGYYRVSPRCDAHHRIDTFLVTEGTHTREVGSAEFQVKWNRGDRVTVAVRTAPTKPSESRAGVVVPTSPLPPTFTNGIGKEFVVVPKGKSWLGGGKNKLGDKEVEIPADFYLGKYEVTQEEWVKVMGKNPPATSHARATARTR